MLRTQVRVDTSGARKALADVSKALRQVVEQAGHEIAADAALRAPVDTGALRQSIHSEMIGEFEALISDGVEYGAYQEYGTVNHPAQPFLGPAVDEGGRALVREVRRVIGA